MKRKKKETMKGRRELNKSISVRTRGEKSIRGIKWEVKGAHRVALQPKNCITYLTEILETERENYMPENQTADRKNYR